MAAVPLAGQATPAYRADEVLLCKQAKPDRAPDTWRRPVGRKERRPRFRGSGVGSGRKFGRNYIRRRRQGEERLPGPIGATCPYAGAVKYLIDKVCLAHRRFPGTAWQQAYPTIQAAERAKASIETYRCGVEKVARMSAAVAAEEWRYRRRRRRLLVQCGVIYRDHVARGFRHLAQSAHRRSMSGDACPSRTVRVTPFAP